jgi:hypothetical protein
VDLEDTAAPQREVPRAVSDGWALSYPVMPNSLVQDLEAVVLTPKVLFNGQGPVPQNTRINLDVIGRKFRKGMC